MGPRDDEHVAGTLERLALEALRFGWGDAYVITVTGGLWKARRRDGLGGVIEARSAEGLRDAIMDDYLTKPVPRDEAGAP